MNEMATNKKKNLSVKRVYQNKHKKYKKKNNK